MSLSLFEGFVREVPKMVPPRGKIPETDKSESGSTMPLTSPSQPFLIPSTLYSSITARRTMARITAFSPGQSPPPVKTPIVPLDCLAIGLRAFLSLPGTRSLFSSPPNLWEGAPRSSPANTREPRNVTGNQSSGQIRVPHQFSAGLELEIEFHVGPGCFSRNDVLCLLPRFDLSLTVRLPSLSLSGVEGSAVSALERLNRIDSPRRGANNDASPSSPSECRGVGPSSEGLSKGVKP